MTLDNLETLDFNIELNQMEKDFKSPDLEAAKNYAMSK